MDYTFPTSKLKIDSYLKPVVLVACGSYNPPTRMHIKMFELAKSALLKEGFNVCGGYMSPVNDGYMKPHLTKASHRVAMSILSAQETDFVMVDPWESMQPSYAPTVEVLHHITKSIQETRDKVPQVMFLCGADVLASLLRPGEWVTPEIILRDYGVVCLHRDGTQINTLLSASDSLSQLAATRVLHISWDDVDEDEKKLELQKISSTAVRNAMAANAQVCDMIYPKVAEYILQHHLYDPASQS